MNEQSFMVQNLTGSEVLSNLTGGTGNCTQSNYWNTFPEYEQIHYYYYPYWYPTYIAPEKSKIEQGFKIVGKLIENKIITKELTIKEFIKLVNDVAEVL